MKGETQLKKLFKYSTNMVKIFMLFFLFEYNFAKTQINEQKLSSFLKLF